MTQEQQELMILKGLVSELPADEQRAVKAAFAHFQELVRQSPSITLLAIAWVALEAQVKPADYGLPG